jgi:hypothetical protein
MTPFPTPAITRPNWTGVIFIDRSSTKVTGKFTVDGSDHQITGQIENVNGGRLLRARIGSGQAGYLLEMTERDAADKQPTWTGQIADENKPAENRRIAAWKNLSRLGTSYLRLQAKTA